MNDNPFYILLDEYKYETESLYYTLIEEIGYENDKNPELQNDLVKAAFAYIVMRYLNIVEGYYGHSDFSSFCNEMQFDFSKNYYYYLLGKEQIEWDIDFEDDDNDSQAFENVIEVLIEKYKGFWSKNLTQKLTVKQLSNIFNEEIYDGDSPGVDANTSFQITSFFEEL